MTVGFNRLIGVNKIAAEIGNKNLTIRFTGYDAGNIEKVSYDIENGEFRLTVVPKAGFTAPQKEQLNLSYAGVSADLVILIGGANDSHFPALASEEFAGANIAHIGTRVLASTREVMSFAKSGATTSEIVANLIKESGFSVDPDIATNLVMGIEEGSSNFAGADVTPETFETFAYLLRSGGARSQRAKLGSMDFPPGAIPNRPFVPQRSATIPQSAPQPEQPEVQDIEGTKEEEQVINPPDDWLQPKIFKGAAANNPDTFSENKG